MKKTDTRSRLQQNKDKLHQRTQWSPQEHPERRNPESNHWEFHGDVTRHGQPKCKRGTQEIPTWQKQRIWENTETNKWNHMSPKKKPKWNRKQHK
jgi:hypothetical protein